MKLPDPVAEVLDHHARNQNNEITADLPCGTRLFTEAQMREALASHEAVMRMALGALTSDEHCNCIPTPLTDKAIKALEDALK